MWHFAVDGQLADGGLLNILSHALGDIQVHFKLNFYWVNWIDCSCSIDTYPETTLDASKLFSSLAHGQGCVEFITRKFFRSWRCWSAEFWFSNCCKAVEERRLWKQRFWAVAHNQISLLSSMQQQDNAGRSSWLVRCFKIAFPIIWI